MNLKHTLTYVLLFLTPHVLVAGEPIQDNRNTVSLQSRLASLTHRVVANGQYIAAAERLKQSSDFKRGEIRCLLLYGACLVKGGKESEAQACFGRPPASFTEDSPYYGLFELVRSTLGQNNESMGFGREKSIDTIFKCPGVAVVQFEEGGEGFGSEWRLLEFGSSNVVWNLGHSQKRTVGELDSIVVKPGAYLFEYRNPQTGDMEYTPFSVPEWGFATNTIAIPRFPAAPQSQNQEYE